ncbi:lysylphosphatidylglycerol synthase domain-containing protein [Aurantimonas sp. MSK8Z-1]|uniref:lysylphosphatidylglycerol synthase transmembrane domain-containing protein n=1 Tax=Mangrovibrevibacter kandeliae TaxID=2968473 RepID=UPI00211870F6|nr:YbhN family protein [Aurantimonas sp. MSK8Z-1]MCW4116778.1 lysylphosphatidylglycerol synthase domain-containing protein [Aurantimonas sp. MSK8Z-1]
MKLKTLMWPVIGLSAVAFSLWLLVEELRTTSIDDIGASLAAIREPAWALSALCALAAYAALAAYDRLALKHLGRQVSWRFITLTSFTAYALSHNLGASVLSGAIVRYRAYSTRGLSGAEVGVLVAFASFTFVLGSALLWGLVLVIEPATLRRFGEHLPVEASTVTGILVLALIALYVFGSWLQLRPLRLWRLTLAYPSLPIVLRQLLIGPVEILGAAGIIYFALPDAGNPGFAVVVGVFLVSFSLALLSHAPGGIGVLEFVFVAGLSDMRPADVLAALLVFRLFYLLIPLALALVVVVGFERRQLVRSLRSIRLRRARADRRHRGRRTGRLETPPGEA